jgi:hypothetical protein
VASPGDDRGLRSGWPGSPSWIAAHPLPPTTVPCHVRALDRSGRRHGCRPSAEPYRVSHRAGARPRRGTPRRNGPAPNRGVGPRRLAAGPIPLLARHGHDGLGERLGILSCADCRPSAVAGRWSGPSDLRRRLWPRRDRAAPGGGAA